MTMSINFLKALQDLNLEKDVVKRDFTFNERGDVSLITSTLNDTYNIDTFITEIFYFPNADVEKIETVYGTAKIIETFRYNAAGDIIGSDITKATV